MCEYFRRMLSSWIVFLFPSRNQFLGDLAIGRGLGGKKWCISTAVARVIPGTECRDRLYKYSIQVVIIFRDITAL